MKSFLFYTWLVAIGLAGLIFAVLVFKNMPQPKALPYSILVICYAVAFIILSLATRKILNRE